MGLPFIAIAIAMLVLCLSAFLALSIPLSKHGCPDRCGNVTIPYPFGIGSKCSANSSFTVICPNSTNPPRPIMNITNLEILKISLLGAITVNQRVSPSNCDSKKITEITLPITLVGTPFSISAKHNTLVNFGCKNFVWFLNGPTGGCMVACGPNSTDATCNGYKCCQVDLLERRRKFQYMCQSIELSNGSFYEYAFLVEFNWLQLNYNEHKSLHSDLLNPFHKDFGFAPLVLEWEAYDLDHLSHESTCSSHIDYYPPFSTYEFTYVSTNYNCRCKKGFEGNPYLPGGCSDIDECSNANFSIDCIHRKYCVNTYGSYKCEYSDGHAGGLRYNPASPSSSHVQTRIKLAFTIVGSATGTLVLLYVAWRSGRAIRKIIKANRRYKFYKRNGGLLLEQQHLATTESGLEKTKVFASKELSKATDHYNENRILGRGGQGTVYKGMLTDGKIVAVKKSKKVDERDLAVFINEVVILSQINHRNVVKLIGCCLETEVPLLVYEFIPNGTLFRHIHEPNEELPLTWEMRVQIATEVAGALAYLHSASSTPIYHRDIKSTNILLDDKYRAKVADFGTSRSVAIDQTHLTTRVLGTFGYIDPEYFQSSQFTEKSDVYSFGVVMVELLTGEKAVTAIRAESGKGLASHFLHSMEENQLFEILDARVLKEGKTEAIVAIAELARRCLNLNGKRRPTMKDVAIGLEAIQRGVFQGIGSLQHDDHNIETHSVDVFDESSDCSSISESTCMDTTNACSKHVEIPLLHNEP